MGDRSIQLVLIGTEMDHESVRSALAECLLTDDELEDDHSAYEDRFPTFEPEEEEELEEATEPEGHDHDHGDTQEEIGIAD